MSSDAWTVAPARRVTGTVRVPGDKSISHRMLLFSALSPGTQVVRGLSTGLDVAATARILGQLGVPITIDGTTATIGEAPEGLTEPTDVLDCGNSGTTMRLMAGLLAGQPFLSVLTGDGSLRKRPMRRVTEPLAKMGALLDGRDDGNLAPLTIRGGNLQGIRWDSPVASAQVKSCLMLASLFATGDLAYNADHGSRDHTERLMQACGVTGQFSPGAVRMACGQSIVMPTGELTVPADVSASAFFWVAASILPGSELLLPDVGINPTRRGYLDAVHMLSYRNERTEVGEERADLVVTPPPGGWKKPLDLYGPIIPALIDEIPILAVFASRLPGVTRVREAADLRAKESDRIRTTAAMLRALGVEVLTRPDGMEITGCPERPLTGGGTIAAEGDHRIAMAGAIGALAADGPVTITGTHGVDTSFPGFLDVLESIVER
ncbi:MAG: 3-phosphoshikimate 1-carboxyvinyltransferase [Proteobacteria bacterium]|nr:3-phosphoshikimate 1-carboxyvinyltransferase [Pseudomonadota bacterium]